MVDKLSAEKTSPEGSFTRTAAVPDSMPCTRLRKVERIVERCCRERRWGSPEGRVSRKQNVSIHIDLAVKVNRFHATKLNRIAKQPNLAWVTDFHGKVTETGRQETIPAQ